MVFPFSSHRRPRSRCCIARRLPDGIGYWFRMAGVNMLRKEPA
ncbi:hypothetical protein BIFDEN_01487 [Bifidobacterium dentium ATCC 27678]|nr:hypothetical protein BIFDEN_01487 [Bifidobacterium dentium ATCC 27678]